jgi:DNA-directed RNA polymerase specialized sigma24 family protein
VEHRAVSFIDQVLEGWGAWASEDGMSQKPAEAYQVLRITVLCEVNFGFVLTEDAFLDLDRAIRHLPVELRAIANIEYRFTRGEGLSHEQKGAMVGLKRTAYRDRLAQVQRMLLSFLEPEFDRRRQISA